MKLGFEAPVDSAVRHPPYFWGVRLPKRKDVDVVQAILRAAKRLPAVNTVWQLKRKTGLDYTVVLHWLQIFKIIYRSGVLPLPVSVSYKAAGKVRPVRRYVLFVVRAQPALDISNKP